MYDELISSLREEAEWAEGNEWEAPIMLSDHLNQAADVIEELEFACNRYEKDYKDLCAYLSKWIPVTERLPDDDTHVLGWDGKRVRFVYVVTDLVFDAFAEKEGITHWMPLPSTEGLNET